MGGNQVNGRPRAVAHHLNVIRDCQAHLFDVFLIVSDSVRIMYFAVFGQCVISTETVFSDDNRQSVSSIYFSQCVAEADRIDFLLPYRHLP